MKTQDLGEEKNDSQPAATPLAAAADSHQPMTEKENPPLTDMPLAAAADSHQPVYVQSNQEIAEVPATNQNLQEAGSHQLGSAIIRDIEEEMNGPQVQRISGLDFDADEIQLDLPAEGSVLMVDT